MRDAVADLLDDLRWARGSSDVRSRLAEEPVRVAPRADALLGALAEHISAQHGMGAPAWSQAPDRFLAQFWFPSNTPALDARAVVESPAAFRRRNIFVSARALVRV